MFTIFDSDALAGWDDWRLRLSWRLREGGLAILVCPPPSPVRACRVLLTVLLLCQLLTSTDIQVGFGKNSGNK